MRKRRILCVWERGSGTGHLFSLSALVRILENEGHETHVCVKEPRYSKQFFSQHGATFLQLPAGLTQRRSALARSHAELLFNFGFGEPQLLVDYLGAWRRLLVASKPDAVFCDHADGALLAAYSLRMPALVIGNGFFQPPVECPFPAYDLGMEVGSDGAVQIEAVVLNAVNSALGVFRSEPLDRLADLYAFAERITLSFPELDCYGSRESVDYVGVLGSTFQQAAPVWDHGGEKVFCYLTRGCLPDPEFVRQLTDNGFSLLLAAPGIALDLGSNLRGQGVSVMDRHVDLERVCAECRLVFSEGNHSTTATILRNGRVPLLLPRQVEQLATANRLANQYLGVLPRRPVQDPIYLKLIESLNDEPAYERNALEFSRKYSDWDGDACVRRIRASVAAFIDS